MFYYIKENILLLIGQVEKTRNKPSFGTRPIPKEVAARIYSRLVKERNIDIFTHSSPDEDTICCAKVMYNWLKKMGKSVSICVNKNETKGLFINPGNFNIGGNSSDNSTLALLLDFNSTTRIPKGYKINREVAQDKILGFDHHETDKNTILDTNSYIDVNSKSCAGILFRFFEACGIKLNKIDYKNLYCGLISDYKKGKLVNFIRDKNVSKLVKLPNLYKDKYAADVLEKIESKLTPKGMAKIYKHLDVLANLTAEERKFVANIEQNVKITPNGKLGYIIIEPENKQWKRLGCDTSRNSIILSDLRLRLINNKLDSGNFSHEQKTRLKNIEGVIIFYREEKNKKSAYKMSISSKDDYAIRLINYIKKEINKNLNAGGHSERAGGSIPSCSEKEVKEFINNFIIASEKVR